MIAPGRLTRLARPGVRRLACALALAVAAPTILAARLAVRLHYQGAALRAAGAASSPSAASGAAIPLALVLLGFCLWVASLVAFIGAGVDKRLRLRPRWATLCAGGFVFGCAIFLIGLGLG